MPFKPHPLNEILMWVDQIIACRQAIEDQDGDPMLHAVGEADAMAEVQYLLKEQGITWLT